MKCLNLLIKAILAGVCVGIGGVVYLSCLAAGLPVVVGAILFGFGLFTIVCFNYNLYTGKIGYLSKETASSLPIILIGNLIGVFGVAGLMLLTGKAAILSAAALPLVTAKLTDTYLSSFILSIFCGFLMYTAVEGAKSIPSVEGQILIIFLCVIVFICCGFEHCIANAFYFAITKQFSRAALLKFLTMIAGNSIGSLTIGITKRNLLDKH